MKNSTLEKLIAHEKSARAIGSIREADSYAKKIAEIKSKMPKAENVIDVNGIWKCSCGATIKLNISGGGKSGRRIGDLLLAPHKVFGHRLKQVS